LEGWKGLKTGGFPFVPNIPGAVRGVKTGVRKAAKRKADNLADCAHKRVKRKIKDIFGP